MDTNGGTRASSPALWTVPNAISALRLLCIPVIWWSIQRPGSGMLGVVVFSLVVATDWVDGFIARRFNQVSEVGKILDPLADLLVIATGLIALCVREAFPWWAAALILVRDAAILAAGISLYLRKHVRVDVRRVGKFATFALMTAVPCVSWGTLDLPAATVFTALGWAAYVVGIVAYYVAAALYVRDMRSALMLQSRTPVGGVSGL